MRFGGGAYGRVRRGTGRGYAVAAVRVVSELRLLLLLLLVVKRLRLKLLVLVARRLIAVLSLRCVDGRSAEAGRLERIVHAVKVQKISSREFCSHLGVAISSPAALYDSYARIAVSIA